MSLLRQVSNQETFLNHASNINRAAMQLTNSLGHATVSVNGKPLAVEWTRAAARKLAGRPQPLVVELELYFSCLVKKFVHFHDAAPQRATVQVTDELHLYFHAVTSTACTMDTAERLGRQPETELDTAATRSMAPKRVSLDFRNGQWQGMFWM